MSSSRKPFSRSSLIAAALVVLSGAALAQPQPPSSMPGIGRPATPKEIAAWDIDVRPDFKGLPKGSGSVAQGQDVWEGKCAHCHGVFGESNEVFSPLVGGTTAADIKTGRVAKLTDTSYPGRTTLMKVSSVSTLWDYINRAMPWTQPKSLKVDEVYAVTAYLLNMGRVLPDHYVMSDKNIADVQARLPNRNGMTLDHGMWPGKSMKTAGQPDVKATACMSNCDTEPKVGSFLPDFARNNHGNLSEQNRLVGAQHGVDTTKPSGSPVVVSVAPTAPAAPAKADSGAATGALLQKYSCTACHAVDGKLVGPSFREVARKYAGKADGVAYLAGKIQSGGSGVWGQIPMPPQTLTDTEARMMGQWLIDGAKK
ncbi:MAG: hypothetical protein RLZZ373_3637 [Pseudomonadota bacterium]